MFITFFILFTYLEYVNEIKSDQQNTTNPQDTQNGANKPNTAELHSQENILILKICFAIICLMGIIGMMIAQIKAINLKPEWFYIVPYVFLLLFIAVSFPVSILVAYKAKPAKVTKARQCGEGFLLGIVTMAIQLVSWHLVFVFYGLILNPLRAFVYSVVTVISIFCLVIIPAALFKLMWLIFKIITPQCKRKCKCGGYDCKDCEKICLLFIDLCIMISLVMLLLFAGAFSIFILHISISSNHPTLNELLKSVIPKILLVVITVVLLKIFLNPKTVKKYWLLLPKIFMDPMEIWKSFEKAEDKTDKNT